MNREEIFAALDRVVRIEEEVASAEAAVGLAQGRADAVRLCRVGVRKAARLALGGEASGVMHAGSFWYVERGELKRLKVLDTSDVIDIEFATRGAAPRSDAASLAYSPGRPDEGGRSE